LNQTELNAELAARGIKVLASFKPNATEISVFEALLKEQSGMREKLAQLRDDAQARKLDGMAKALDELVLRL